MAEQDQQDQTTTENESGTGGGAGGTAVKAAAAAAATGVAALAARKALSGRGDGGNGQPKNGGSPGSGGSDSIFSSMLSGGWEAARDSLLPVAEDAAGAAGEFLGRNAPEVIRDRILPRFISSFNEAKEGA